MLRTGRATMFIATLLVLSATPCAGSELFELISAPEDSAVASELRSTFEAGVTKVEKFFGGPYRTPFTIELLPGRKEFTAWFPEEWGMADTACWMVATGVDRRLAMLSPRVWGDEACEHDAADAAHVRNLIVHELVHVYHGQVHPSVDFEVPGIEDIGWFVEGLATYASGQLDQRHGSAAATAIEEGDAPTRLAEGWSGQHRYGVSGSLVRYIDEVYGRDVVIQLMRASTEAEILDRLKVTEQGLLQAWRAFVTQGDE